MLNPKQERFCHEYASSGSATQSYMQVYQTKDSAVAQAAASRLLADERIQARLRELSEEIKDSTIADRQELLQTATAVLRGQVKSATFDRNGGIVELPPALKDRLKALELLAKIQGLFVSKQEIEMSGATPIIIVDNV